MSDNQTRNEDSVTVGTVDGPRERVLNAVRRDIGLNMGNFPELLECTTEEDTVNCAQAILDLIELGEIHSTKGRYGGLKLGAKPAPTGKSLAAMALAKARAAKEAANKGQ